MRLAWLNGTLLLLLGWSLLSWLGRTGMLLRDASLHLLGWTLLLHRRSLLLHMLSLLLHRLPLLRLLRRSLGIRLRLSKRRLRSCCARKRFLRLCSLRGAIFLLLFRRFSLPVTRLLLRWKLMIWLLSLCGVMLLHWFLQWSSSTWLLLLILSAILVLVH